MFCTCFGNSCTDIWRFEDLGQGAHRQAGCGHHFFRPASVRNVEHQCARGFGDVYGMFAAQAEADIIFRQKHAAKMFPEFRLVVAHPEELCEGEVGQRRIAGELDDFALAELRVQPVALRLCALVAPDQRGPEHFVIADDGAEAEVQVVEPTGSELQIAARIGGDDVIAVFRERHDFKPGDKIRLKPDPRLVHLFDAPSGQRLTA